MPLFDWIRSDLHSLNLDWIISKIKTVEESEQGAVDAAADANASKTAAAASATAANNSKTAAAGSATAAAGSAAQAQALVDQLDTTIAQDVSDWLENNLTPTSPPVDDTLTIQGAAADAKKTGDEISDLKTEINSGIGVSVLPNGVTFGKTLIYEYENMPLSDGYIKSDGTTQGTTHKHFEMSGFGIESVTLHITQSVAGLNALYTKENDVLTVALTTDNAGDVTYRLPPDFTGDLVFNYYIPDYMDTFTIKYKTEWETENAENVKYGNVVSKPYNLEGKKIHFYGDSIIYGYTTNGQLENPIPTLFGNAVNALDVQNRAVSGSGYAVAGATILSKIQSYGNLNIADIIIIGAGINDWQRGVTSTELQNAVATLCEYLKLNFTGKVIFITPINHSGRMPSTTPAQSVQSVRNVITRTVLSYDYDVVQGWTFPFPNEYDTSAFKTLMLPDNIHPSQTGANVYAKCLQTAVI